MGKAVDKLISLTWSEKAREAAAESRRLHRQTPEDGMLRPNEKHDHLSGLHATSGGMTHVTPPRLGRWREVAKADGTLMGSLKEEGPDSTLHHISVITKTGVTKEKVRGFHQALDRMHALHNS